MNVESMSFTEQDLYAFIREVIDYEVSRPLDGLPVTDRLEVASDRLAEVVGRMGDGARGVVEGWSPKEILAHITLVSQVFGWATRAVGNGEQTEIDVTSFLLLRDLAGMGFAELPVAELLAIARAEHRSTIDYLRSADPEALERRARVYPFPLSVEQIAQFHVCAHLELHIEQLQEALEPRSALGPAA